MYTLHVQEYGLDTGRVRSTGRVKQKSEEIVGTTSSCKNRSVANFAKARGFRAKPRLLTRDHSCKSKNSPAQYEARGTIQNERDRAGVLTAPETHS